MPMTFKEENDDKSKLPIPFEHVVFRCHLACGVIKMISTSLL